MLDILKKLVPHRYKDENGASAVEYGLLVALIAAVIVLAVWALGSMVKDTFNDTCSTITSKATNVTASEDCAQ
jgi:pilus assembly protein Flp/PilA